MLEEHSRYFRVGLHGDPASAPPRERNNPRWISAKDLEHAAEMNKVGYGKSTRSYNHDKYKHDLDSHQYRLIGDVLKRGNDFSALGNIRPKLAYKRVAPKEKKYKLDPFLPSTEPQVDLPVNVPSNIKHEFGTKVCNHLLQDKEVVDTTIDTQKKNHDLFYKTAKPAPEVSYDLSQSPETTYDRLGNTLRMNMFPGFTQDHKRSLAHSVYTQNVYDRRQPVPEQWKYQRDELSKYA